MSSLIEMQAELDWIEGPIEKSKKKLLELGNKDPDRLTSEMYSRFQALKRGRKAGMPEAGGMGAKRDYQNARSAREYNTARSKENRGGKVGGGAPTAVTPAAPGAPGNPTPSFGMKRQQRKALRARKKKGFGQGAVNPAAQKGGQYANSVAARVNANTGDKAKQRLRFRQEDRYVFSGGPRPSMWD